MKNLIIESLKEKSYTVDYTQSDEEKSSYQIYTDNCEIMCCIDFYDNGDIAISPAHAEDGTGKCTDNSEDEFFETGTNEHELDFIINRIEMMIEEKELTDYNCEEVELYEISDEKLKSKLNSDHPDSFKFKNNDLCIVRLTTPENETHYFEYDLEDEYKDIYLENEIYNVVKGRELTEQILKSIKWI